MASVRRPRGEGVAETARSPSKSASDDLDSTDSPDCLPILIILLIIKSVFYSLAVFPVVHFSVFGSVRYRLSRLMSAFGCRLMIASRIVSCRNDRPLINRLDSTALLSVGLVFTARCYASAVLAMALCLSVRPSVCPSQVGVLRKRRNVGSHKQHHTIAQGL